MVSQEENDSFLATKSKDTKYYSLNKEFKIAVTKKFNEQTQKSNTMISGNKINKEKEYFSKKIETLKKNQTNSRVGELNK